MLEIDKIRQLIEMMVDNDLIEISLRDGEEEVSLRRPTTQQAVESFVASAAGPASTPAAPAPTAASPPAAEPPAEDGDLVTISSPMVGTFYRSSDPESDPFVQIGTEIHAGSVVCILEAMKVFNEIKAEVSGFIEKILVKNEQSVEFGQPLFLVRPT